MNIIQVRQEWRATLVTWTINTFDTCGIENLPLPVKWFDQSHPRRFVKVVLEITIHLVAKHRKLNGFVDGLVCAWCNHLQSEQSNQTMRKKPCSPN